ncbi:MAG TPA: hypothetical protein VFC63_03190 [Blastocatellia bacterium]|nr:hypothetical protein [Blastocatellia bacterium]
MAFLKSSISLLAVALVCAAVSFAVYGKGRVVSRDGFSDEEEINQSFALSNGSQVRIHTINGTVKVDTWDQAKADIHIVKRTNRGPEELKRLDVIIDHSSDSLEIRTNKQNDDDDIQVNVTVEVKLPRQMSLNVGGINGKTDIGPVNGVVSAHGINGHVSIAQSSEELSIDGINGSVTASLTSLGSNGIRMSGINGSITIGIPEDANATIDVTGHNGGFNSDLPLSFIGEMRRNQTHAQLGSGGSPIRMSGINGGIHLKKSQNGAM